MHKTVLFAAILPLAVFAAKEQQVWPVAGAVAEECAVAVGAKPILYTAATFGREDAIRNELRVRDSKGCNIPYAFRVAKTRVVDEVKEWRVLKVTRVAESEGRLVVDAEWPDAAGQPHPERFLALKVATPLSDFEQAVEVSSESVSLANGILCDYQKFADLRVTEIPLETAFRRTMTITFAKPTSEAAAALFERTISENGEGKLEVKSVRESVENRPFRIDSLSVAIPRKRVRFEAASPMNVGVVSTVETDSKTKKTVIEASVFGLPMTALVVNALDRNFSRKVSVFRRMDARWHPLASGRISAINLPGERKSNLEISFGREVREQALRIEIENDDNSPLNFATSAKEASDCPVMLKVMPYDIVFVATPGEKYSLVIEPGAVRPRYDEVILGYIDRVQDPLRFEIDSESLSPENGIIGCKDGSTAIYSKMPFDVIPFISVIVFIMLGLICIRLIRSSNSPK